MRMETRIKDQESKDMRIDEEEVIEWEIRNKREDGSRI